jgi:hypothetical protein
MLMWAEHVAHMEELNSAEFEVLIAVIMKSSVFWDIMSSRPFKTTQLYAGFLLGLFFDSENGGDIFLINVT